MREKKVIYLSMDERGEIENIVQLDSYEDAYVYTDKWVKFMKAQGFLNVSITRGLLSALDEMINELKVDCKKSDFEEILNSLKMLSNEFNESN